MITKTSAGAGEDRGAIRVDRQPVFALPPLLLREARRDGHIPGHTADELGLAVGGSAGQVQIVRHTNAELMAEGLDPRESGRVGLGGSHRGPGAGATVPAGFLHRVDFPPARRFPRCPLLRAWGQESRAEQTRIKQVVIPMDGAKGMSSMYKLFLCMGITENKKGT